MAAEKDVEIFTGEESERLVWKNRCKLYRFGDGEWKQRGTGEVTYLQHIEKGNIRIVMRQEKTGKVVMNHYVNPSEKNKLEENFGNQKSRVWSATDFSDDGSDTMTFAIRFAKEEEAAKFADFFGKAKKINGSDVKEELREYFDPLYAEEPVKVDISLEKRDTTSAPPEEAASKPAKVEEAEAASKATQGNDSEKTDDDKSDKQKPVDDKEEAAKPEKAAAMSASSEAS